ncbi:Asp-tRNA(Asn)/Glu-tRNA(Gln) amidotransferase subunit GatA [Oceanospirillaceae bacterium]|jgi:aspartyl-tRNA(Asn)/glutamyl-tRNA(Gln) amidotransferase subunit A|nr:Asp-tRNA(Asn)/Glu-tRNA(Gln) amidotransferase subunit GatA [Oceanospirillaceae bacterium]MDB0001426.1 Asp-tRNA(Asn)/Glu-tRNA(Gln) amidotransferase subunit GatA [Oceanospirillaceae bacterium]MDB9906000.1 Asp-tRNA(Asn)/Glu-tRNA(Gln) amidotransferase subunit GatA [Oceanospirillaceae bacterium]MDC1351156.1 Asp-tRNA(Asn)/Glu-tRNA(Gln) amidotransferase subunit GatA [Oceanospirillaceae bacterium]MDC1425317.1 Asp-tRNA(Asn)/Glu-tRNA(Gln) amidotransferase subunit GatA [Oceanospirillaceae bacterium]
MTYKTLVKISKDLAAGDYSSRELTQDVIADIKARDSIYNSFISVSEDLALRQADAADARISAGTADILTGVPFAHKDLFCTQDHTTTAASKMLEHFVPPYESTVGQRLLSAGAVCVGKTNMDEFAMGSSNESSYFGVVKNPWDLMAVPGGSSGGSAAAVAAGLVPAATGTDTGGSIRQPASFCNLTGIKPTYGRVSRFGIIAYASSLDQAGPMCQTAEDAALMLNAMAGFDEQDSTSVQLDTPDFTADLNLPLQGLKVGLPKEFFGPGLNPQVAECVMTAVKQIESLGAQIIDISLPNLELSIPAYYVIAPSEASSNLSRFDGVRYGFRCDQPQDLMDLYCRTRAEGFGTEVKRRIMVGTYALSEGYYDAYYVKAQRIRRLIKNDFARALAQVDVIMGPVAPTPAFDLGSNTKDPVAMYLEDIYTLSANMAGIPAMSAPAGFVGGRPVGLHIMGNYFNEAKLLNIAHQYQQITDWHLQTPATNPAKGA